EWVAGVWMRGALDEGDAPAAFRILRQAKSSAVRSALALPVADALWTAGHLAEAVRAYEIVLAQPELDQSARERSEERLASGRSMLPVEARQATAAGPEPMPILVAGHDLRFVDPLLTHFRRDPRYGLRVERWKSPSEPPDERFDGYAKLVFCEWCTNNAVWYSQHKRPGQRLVVRLHRFEL